MKCRVFKKADGRVIYSWPNPRYQNSPNFEGCKFPPETDGLPFVDLDESELPSEVGRDWDWHGPLFFDGEPHKNNLKFDEGWNCYLMPTHLIKKRHIKNLKSKIENCLKHNVQDAHEVSALNFELFSCEQLSEKEWYAKALENLDRRCNQGEPDKPIIREKLMSAINKDK